MFWVILLISGVLSYLLLIQLPKRLTLLNKLKTVRGPPALPLLGNALDLSVARSEVLQVFLRFFKDYGPRFKMFLGMQPYIVFGNASDAEKILSSQTQIEKSADYDFLHEWLGLGLLNSRGEKWFHRRKQLTPAFHFKILEDFLRVFNEQCAVFKSALEGKGHEKFDIFPVITLCTLDIICETTMGRRVFAQQKSDSDYVRAIYRISELFQYRQMRPWLHSDFIWRRSQAGKENEKCLKILHGFTDLVIRERKEERKALGDKENANGKADNDGMESKKRLAFLDLLLDAQNADSLLTDKNVREETDTFMFEGHDTTSAGVSWTTFLLSLNPECQEKVHQELDEIFGNDRTREVTMADLAKMKYLECCIKEGLRIFPSAPFIGRKLTSELKLEDGLVLPSSITVWIFIYYIHRDPKIFPNPEKFDPNRFLLEEAQGRHPFSYLPFSAGPRNCIGQKFAMMEEKVMLATIFRNFNVKAAQRMEDVNRLCEVIMRPEAGLWVTMQKR
ncbi:Cytochrome P450 4c3 [Orchesella cincta]|uniref:Cytochrome P450 4c3 n=1 Tax=Orchesella cincta TaxID=48709 RepID=A0A1D2NDR1_ORCCI|nr:Cytochrome P450 4c3 [Orchesella cincta]